MKIIIQDGDITVTVNVGEPEKDETRAERMLIAAMKACECFEDSERMIRAYYHVNPDTLDLREDSDELWKLFKKHGIAFHFHIKETSVE